MGTELCVKTEPANEQEFLIRKPLLVIAKHSFKGRNNDELSFHKNNVISVTQKLEGGWWEGSLDGRIGWFPSDFVGIVNVSSSNDAAGNANTFGLSAESHLEAKKLAYRSELIKTFTKKELENQQKINQLFITLKSIEEAEKISEFSSVVKSLAEFLALKNDILEELEKQTANPLNSQLIGKIFLDIELRTVLSTYCNIHCDFMDFINLNTETVGRLLSVRNIDLKELVAGLSLVFRHVDKYANILQEIERNTPEGHTDKGNLFRASLVYADFYAECERIRKQREAQLYFIQSGILENGFGKGFEQSLGAFLFIGKVTVISEADQCEGGTEVGRCVAIFERALLLVEHCAASDKNTLRNHFDTKNLSIRRGNMTNEIQIDVLTEKGTKLILRAIGSDDFKQIWRALKKCDGICLRMSSNDEQQPNFPNELMHHTDCDFVDSSPGGAQSVTTNCGLRLNHHLEMILPGEDSSENAINCVTSEPSVLRKPFSGWALRPYPPHRAEWLQSVGRAASVKMRKGLTAEEQEDALMLRIIEGYCVSGPNCATASHFCARKPHEQRNSTDSFYSPCGGGPVRRAASYPDQHEISVRPQLIVAEDEKLFVEELEGDKFVVKERSLVDTVYSLKDQISVLTKEVTKMAKALEQEQRTRRRLEEMVIRQAGASTAKAQNGTEELSHNQ